MLSYWRYILIANYNHKLKKLILILLVLLSGLFLGNKKIYAKPTTSFDIFQITNDGNQQNGPLIWDNTVIWTDWRGTDALDIWMYNLRNKKRISFNI
jgi:beta propeller repeat protein